MTKTVSVQDSIHRELVPISGDLTSMLEKQISLGMTIHLLTCIYRHITTSPEFEDLFDIKPFAEGCLDEYLKRSKKHEKVGK